MDHAHMAAMKQMSIDEYLLKNPHKKLLYNPLAAEFGIENMSQMNQFVNNQLPKFKMVSGWTSRSLQHPAVAGMRGFDGGGGGCVCWRLELSFQGCVLYIPESRGKNAKYLSGIDVSP